MLDNTLGSCYYVYMIRNNQTTQILEWLGTSILIIGVGINSLGYYPLGPIIMIFGGLTWVVVGIMWNRLSIITTNLVITIVSLIGLSINYGLFG